MQIRLIAMRLALCCFSLSLHAKSFIDNLVLPNATQNKSFHASFLAPNEYYPHDAKEIWKQAPAGLYLAVGSERGFIGASVAAHPTHLLLVDVNQEMIQFNKTNIALLKLAKSRRDYLWLRLQASREQWQMLAQKRNLDADSAQILEEEFDNWDKKVRKSGDFSNFHQSRFGPFMNSSFWRTSYLWNDAQFEKLKNMARLGQIASLHLDLKDTKNLLIESGKSSLALQSSNLWLFIRRWVSKGGIAASVSKPSRISRWRKT